MSATGAKGETRIEEPSAAERAIARRAPSRGPRSPISSCRPMSTWPRRWRSAKRRDARPPRSSCGRARSRCARCRAPTAPTATGASSSTRAFNVGFVVATPQAYLIPTVFDADRKTLAELTEELAQLERAALAGELPPPAYSGATFTLSDVGALGVPASTIVVNSPQAAAVAAGAIREAPVVRDGRIVPGNVMTVTLACDHRILYGAHAAAFLAEITTRIDDRRRVGRGPKAGRIPPTTWATTKQRPSQTGCGRSWETSACSARSRRSRASGSSPPPSATARTRTSRCRSPATRRSRSRWWSRGCSRCSSCTDRPRARRRHRARATTRRCWRCSSRTCGRSSATRS